MKRRHSVASTPGASTLSFSDFLRSLIFGGGFGGLLASLLSVAFQDILPEALTPEILAGVGAAVGTVGHRVIDLGITRGVAGQLARTVDFWWRLAHAKGLEQLLGKKRSKELMQRLIVDFCLAEGGSRTQALPPARREQAAKARSLLPGRGGSEEAEPSEVDGILSAGIDEPAESE